MSVESTVEALDASRRRTLWGLLLSMGVWQGLDVLAKVLVLTGHPGPWQRLALLLSLPGWLYWCVGLVRQQRWLRQVRGDPALLQALNDELTRDARQRAWTVGFFSMLFVQAPFLVLGAFVPVPGALVAQVTLLVGTVASTGAFLRFERGAAA